MPTIQQMIVRFFQRKDGRMDGWMDGWMDEGGVDEERDRWMDGKD